MIYKYSIKFILHIMKLYLICISLVIFLPFTHAFLYFQQNQGYVFDDERNVVFYSNFANCDPCQQSYVMTYTDQEEINIEVWVPLSSSDKVVVSQEGGVAQGARPTLQTIEVDHVSISVYEKIWVLNTVSYNDTQILLQVAGLSIDAHYAIYVGPSTGYDYTFFELTFSFAWIVQAIRRWGRVLYLPFIMPAYFLLYFLVWPLRKKQPHSTNILAMLAVLSYLSWITDAMIQYFTVMEHTADRSVISFLLNILPNFIFILSISQALSSYANIRIILYQIIAVLSFAVGGSGFYVGPLMLLLASLFIATTPRRVGSKYSKLICRV